MVQFCTAGLVAASLLITGFLMWRWRGKRNKHHDPVYFFEAQIYCKSRPIVPPYISNPHSLCSLAGFPLLSGLIIKAMVFSIIVQGLRVGKVATRALSQEEDYF